MAEVVFGASQPMLELLLVVVMAFVDARRRTTHPEMRRLHPVPYWKVRQADSD